MSTDRQPEPHLIMSTNQQEGQPPTTITLTVPKDAPITFSPSPLHTAAGIAGTWHFRETAPGP